MKSLCWHNDTKIVSLLLPCLDLLLSGIFPEIPERMGKDNAIC